MTCDACGSKVACSVCEIALGGIYRKEYYDDEEDFYTEGVYYDYDGEDDDWIPT